MVDTINPQTGKEDEFASNGMAQSGNAAETFYSGFGKADDVHVNLAGEHQTTSPTAEIKTPVEPPQSAPAHQVYAAKKFTYWRPLALLTAGSIGLVLLTYFITSLITSSVLQGKLKEEEANTANLEQEYNSLVSNTEPLELPVAAPTTEETVTENPTTPSSEVENSAETNETIEVPVRPSSSYLNGQG